MRKDINGYRPHTTKEQLYHHVKSEESLEGPACREAGKERSSDRR